MPSSHNHREQLYLEGAFFRQLKACEDGGVTEPGGQSQLVKYYRSRAPVRF